MREFYFQPMFEEMEDTTEYRKISGNYVSTQPFGNQEMLMVDSKGLEILAIEALDDVSHLLRSSHLEMLETILKDPEASSNDKFVAMELLKNAVIAAERVFPSCQDTGTVIVMANKGEMVQVYGDDEEALSRGIYATFQDRNLRFSQLAPLSMYDEKNTGNNLPAQIDLLSKKGDSYEFLFIAKGGGSANKSFLYQKTKSLLNPQSMERFVKESLNSLGTAACPPYHLALVIGGPSAESNLKTVKLASCGYYDNLSETGNIHGRAFRDKEFETIVEKWAREGGIGAQFGGKYFVHDVRVIRMPRHGASCPVGIGVSCAADRQIKGKINKDGIFLEQLERDPARFLPADLTDLEKEEAIVIDLNQPMEEIRKTLRSLKVATRIILNGPHDCCPRYSPCQT